MKHKDMVVAAISKDGAAEFSNLSRCFQPALSLGIEVSKFLQRSILFFRQELNAHGGGHINRVTAWRLPLLRRLTVVTNLSAAGRTLRRAIVKDVLARPFILSDNIRFTASSFHFIERPQFFSIRFQLCLYLSPLKPFMAVKVLLKTGFQGAEQVFTLFW